MFKFLKEKLKSAISSFSKKAEEEAAEEPKEKEAAKKEKKAEKPRKEKKEKPKKEAKEKPKVEKLKQEKKEIPKPLPAEKEIKEKVKEAEKAEEEKEEAEKPEEKKGFFGKLKGLVKREEREKPAEPEKKEIPKERKPEAPEKKAEEKPEEKEEAPEEEPEEKEEKKGFFARVKEAVSTKTISEAQFEKMFWDLEIALLENNVAMEVVEKIKEDLRKNIVDKRVERGKFEQIIGTTLYDSISSLFDVERINLIKEIKNKKPYIIAFVGVNGSGKTTTIAKIARLMQNSKLKPVIAAADTFRAAAIQQLEEHGNKLGVKVIKHDYGSDPAAVAFDAIKYAQSKGLDVVLIDTAGRQHSNTNLMDEMKKIARVANPDLKVFIGESITGNDCIEQAKSFNEAIGIDAIVLTKADIDEKGGAAVSVSYVTGKPILFIGMGQGYDDLKEFDKNLIMENIGLA